MSKFNNRASIGPYALVKVRICYKITVVSIRNELLSHLKETWKKVIQGWPGGSTVLGSHIPTIVFLLPHLYWGCSWTRMTIWILATNHPLPLPSIHLPFCFCFLFKAKERRRGDRKCLLLLLKDSPEGPYSTSSYISLACT